MQQRLCGRSNAAKSLSEERREGRLETCTLYSVVAAASGIEEHSQERSHPGSFERRVERNRATPTPTYYCTCLENLQVRLESAVGLIFEYIPADYAHP